LVDTKKALCGVGRIGNNRQLYITADGGTIALDWVMSPLGKFDTKSLKGWMIHLL
jgi:hypothetical protein